MYSRIPMPQVEWKEENRRYSLCFFPLIGAVIGGIFLIWRMICSFWDFGILLYSAGAAAIPVLITGGIHIDGYCDVSDAIASCGDHKRRLEIMSDPHIGSFAVIKLVTYVLIQTALYSELDSIRAAAVPAVGFVLSRSLSGLAAVSFKCAKKTGYLQDFVRPAHRRANRIVLAVWTLLSCAAMILISPAGGTAAAAAALLVFAYYRHFAYKNFGGITGDLAGWFLQLCELFTAAAAVFP